MMVDSTHPMNSGLYYYLQQCISSPHRLVHYLISCESKIKMSAINNKILKSSLQIDDVTFFIYRYIGLFCIYDELWTSKFL